MRQPQVLGCISCLCVTASVSAGVVASSTFDTGPDGWTATPAGEVSWVGAGGNPGGYLRFTDSIGVSTFLIAPTKFLGDWSKLNEVGSLFFDHRIFQTGRVKSFLPYDVRISGPGGDARWTGPTPTGVTPWVKQLEAPIAIGDWVVNSGTWADLLSNVTDLRIRIELVFNANFPDDIAGIDNIRLVPAPATAFVVGGSVLVLRTRRRRR